MICADYLLEGRFLLFLLNSNHESGFFIGKFEKRWQEMIPWVNLIRTATQEEKEPKNGHVGQQCRLFIAAKATV